MLIFKQRGHLKYRVSKETKRYYKLCEVIALIGIILSFPFILDYYIPFSVEKEKILNVKTPVSYSKRGKKVYSDQICTTYKGIFYVPRNVWPHEGDDLYIKRSKLFNQEVNVSIDGKNWFSVPENIHQAFIVVQLLFVFTILTVLLLYYNIEKVELVMGLSAFSLIGEVVVFIILLNHNIFILI